MNPSCNSCPVAPCATNACTDEARARLAVLTPFFESLGITKLWLHGSRAMGTGSELSDWDFLVEFSRPICPREYCELKAALQATFANRVDLCSPQYSPADFVELIRHYCVQIYP